MTEETKTKRVRRSAEEIAAELRERADKTERAGRLAAIKSHPVGAPLYAALVALGEAHAAPGAQDVAQRIENACSVVVAALSALGLDTAGLV